MDFPTYQILIIFDEVLNFVKDTNYMPYLQGFFPRRLYNRFCCRTNVAWSLGQTPYNWKGLNSSEDSHNCIGSGQKDPDFISDSSAQLAFR